MDKDNEKDEFSECDSGDAKIELASSSYDEWLAGQGLLLVSETEDRYDLQLKVEDISDDNAKEDENQLLEKETDKVENNQDEEENLSSTKDMQDAEDGVQEGEYVKTAANLENLTEQVTDLLSKDTEERSEMRISRLNLILQLLDEEKKEQREEVKKSMDKKDGDGDVPIRKMMPDEVTVGRSINSAGSGMQSTKLLVDQSEKPKFQSKETAQQKEGTGTQNIGKKPELHRQLTGLFSLKEKYCVAKLIPKPENTEGESNEAEQGNGKDGVESASNKSKEKTACSGVGLMIRKIEDSEVDQTEKKKEDTDTTKDCEITDVSVDVIGSNDTVDSDGTKHINKPGELRSDIRKIEVADKDESSDEYDNNLVIDEDAGKSNVENEKKVLFQLETDDTSSIQCSEDKNVATVEIFEMVETNVTHMSMDDRHLEETFPDNGDDDDYPPLSQNVHRARYIRADDSSDSEPKWADLHPGDKLAR